MTGLSDHDGRNAHTTKLAAFGVVEDQVRQVVKTNEDYTRATAESVVLTDQLTKALEKLSNEGFAEAKKTMQDFMKTQRDQADASAHLVTERIVEPVKVERENLQIETERIEGSYATQRKAIIQTGDQLKTAAQDAGTYTARFGAAIDRNVTLKLEALSKAHFEHSIQLLSQAFQTFGQIVGGVAGQGVTAFGSMATSFASMWSAGTAASILSVFGAVDALFKLFQTPSAQAYRAMIRELGATPTTAKGKAPGPFGQQQALGAQYKSLTDVDAFAATYGGWDSLKNHLASLGDQASSLWASLQGAKGDKDLSIAAIKAVGDAFTAQADKVKAAADDLAHRNSADFAYETFGLPKPADLKKSADDLKQAYADAVKSGAFSTGQLDAMWQTVLDAENKAAGLGKAGVFAGFDDDMQIANDLGLSIDDLGKKFQQAKVTEDASTLGSKLKQLLDDGADVNGILKSDSAIQKIQDIVSESLKNGGVAIPDILKQFIEPLVAAGKLTDENGAGLTLDNWQKLQFSVPDALVKSDDLTKSVVETNDASENLAVSLSGPDGLTKGLIDASRAVDGMLDSLDPFFLQGPITPSYTPPSGGGGGKLPSFAVGTGGSYLSRPIVAQLHPNEAITPRADVPDLARDIATALTTHLAGAGVTAAGVMANVNVYIGNRQVTDFFLESNLQAIEKNDGGGSPVGPNTRLRKALGVK